MKKGLNILTLAKILMVFAVVGLIYWNFAIIEENVSAQSQIEERETAVIEKEKQLKEIVEMYHKANGKYPGSCDEIVKFAKEGYVVEKREVYDRNNLGKYEYKKGYVDPIWGEFSKDTIWHEPSYRLLAAKAKKANPNFDNYEENIVYARKTITAKLTDEQIENLRYIPYTDNKIEFQIDTLTGPYGDHRFRCHAPYVKFLDTKEYNQQFWNYIEDKFNYFVKNAEGNADKFKQMTADGAYKAITTKITVTDENGVQHTTPKYYIGSTPESRIYLDINFFGVTFGDLEKATLDGSWEDQRAKK